MFGIGPGEIVGIMVVLLLLFGAKKLPEFARGLGQGIGEFRRSLTHPIEGSQSEEKRPALTPSGASLSDDASG